MSWDQQKTLAAPGWFLENPLQINTSALQFRNPRSRKKGQRRRSYPSWRSNIHLSKQAEHSDEKTRSERDTYPCPHWHHQATSTTTTRAGSLERLPAIMMTAVFTFPHTKWNPKPPAKPIRIALEPLRTPARLLWAEHRQHRQHEATATATTTTFRIQLGGEAGRDHQRSSEGCNEKSPKKKDCVACLRRSCSLRRLRQRQWRRHRQCNAAPRGDGGSLNSARQLLKQKTEEQAAEMPAAYFPKG